MTRTGASSATTSSYRIDGCMAVAILVVSSKAIWRHVIIVIEA
jgi:hypothetical protein